MVCLVNAFDLNSEEYRGGIVQSLEILAQSPLIEINELLKRIEIEIEVEVLR